MTLLARELYHSANGDRWSLVREQGRDHVSVRHEPNLASGGTVSIMDLSHFLGQPGQGPQHQALLRLIAGLVDEAA
jgi:hypothetical protein